jgi:hypothetical protein
MSIIGTSKTALKPTTASQYPILPIISSIVSSGEAG